MAGGALGRTARPAPHRQPQRFLRARRELARRREARLGAPRALPFGRRRRRVRASPARRAGGAARPADGGRRHGHGRTHARAQAMGAHPARGDAGGVRPHFAPVAGGSPRGGPLAGRTPRAADRMGMVDRRVAGVRQPARAGVDRRAGATAAAPAPGAGALLPPQLADVPDLVRGAPRRRIPPRAARRHAVRAPLCAVLRASGRRRRAARNAAAGDQPDHDRRRRDDRGRGRHAWLVARWIGARGRRGQDRRRRPGGLTRALDAERRHRCGRRGRAGERRQRQRPGGRAVVRLAGAERRPRRTELAAGRGAAPAGASLLEGDVCSRPRSAERAPARGGRARAWCWSRRSAFATPIAGS